MSYRRRYNRKSYPRDKYSVEQSAGSITFEDTITDAAQVVVPSSSAQGMRKVKHLTINLASSAGSGGVIYWALVYNPEGITPNTLNVDGTSLYEPNQFVMNAGVWDADSGPNRISSPIARNLNSGDQIYLILKRKSSSGEGYVEYCVRYAVTLQ